MPGSPNKHHEGFFSFGSKPQAAQTLLSPLHDRLQGLGRSRRFMREGWKCLSVPDFLQNPPALAGESSAIPGSLTQPPKPQFSLEPRSHPLQHTFTVHSCLP